MNYKKIIQSNSPTHQVQIDRGQFPLGTCTWVFSNWSLDLDKCQYYWSTIQCANSLQLNNLKINVINCPGTNPTLNSRSAMCKIVYFEGIFFGVLLSLFFNGENTLLNASPATLEDLLLPNKRKQYYLSLSNIFFRSFTSFKTRKILINVSLTDQKLIVSLYLYFRSFAISKVDRNVVFLPALKFQSKKQYFI